MNNRISLEDLFLIRSKFVRGFPVPQRLFNDLENNFYLSYVNSYITCEETENVINQNIDSHFELKIPVSVLLAHISFDAPYTEQEGVAIYYILRQYGIAGRFYYTYAITPAIFVGEEIIPVAQPDGQVKYLVPTFDEGYETINQTELENYKQLYFDNVEIRNFTENKNYLIKDFATHFGKLHPTNTFYTEFELYHFHENNKDIAINPAFFYLIFNHGAIYSANAYGNFKVQTPVLVFEYNGSKLLNNLKLDPTKPYLNKALDLGRMCPPECN